MKRANIVTMDILERNRTRRYKVTTSVHHFVKQITGLNIVSRTTVPHLFLDN